MSNFLDNNVSQYTINPDGSLTPMSSPIVATGAINSIVVDPSGKYAYMAEDVGSISQYGTNADGSLTFMTTPTVAAGTNPSSVTTVRQLSITAAYPVPCGAQALEELSPVRAERCDSIRYSPAAQPVNCERRSIWILRKKVDSFL